MVEFGETLTGFDAVPFLGVHAGDDAVALRGKTDDATFDVEAALAAGNVTRTRGGVWVEGWLSQAERRTDRLRARAKAQLDMMTVLGDV